MVLKQLILIFLYFCNTVFVDLQFKANARQYFDYFTKSSETELGAELTDLIFKGTVNGKRTVIIQTYDFLTQKIES